MNNTSKRCTLGSLLITIGIFTNPVYADDTEIFFSENMKDIRQNIMFIIDGSGSMNVNVNEGGDSRLDIMKKALSTVLKSAPDNLNVGLMNYGEDPYRIEGHGVKFPATPINDLALPVVGGKIPVDGWGNKEWWYSSIPEPSATITVREYLSQITDWYWRDNWYTHAYDNVAPVDMPRQGATPIVDALYEAALYFRGDSLGFGFGDAGYWNRWAAHPSTYEGDLITWDSSSCNSTYEYTVSPAIDFVNEEYPWLTCKGSKKWTQRLIELLGGSVPDSTPSYLNCMATESCKTLKYKICDEKIAGYCSNPQVTELGTTCPDGDWVDSYCKDEKYHYEYIDKCTYDVCTGEYTPKSNYVSPITQECQNNYIVLLSDGKPGNINSLTENETYKGLQSGKLPTLTNKADSADTFSHVSCDSNPEPSGFRHGVCGPELARFLADSDNSDLEGKQGIQTYTIGFGLGGEPESENYLKSLVTADNPETDVIEGYYSASDEKELASAFSTILSEISATTTSFAAPGYSVNTNTGLSNEKVVYIPVFDKQLTPRWNGNLKKFKLDTDDNGANVITGKNDKVAVSELGVFEEDALDLWSNSTSADGREVSRGGASSLIDPNNRLAVTDLACTAYPCALNTLQNLIKTTNAAITNSVLGLADDATEAQRRVLVNFARGSIWNEATESYDLEPHMGDMLHTEPVVVTYDKSYASSSFDPGNGPGQVVFAATNEGYLHAFDSTTGKELFAYMPSDLMKNINVQYENTDVGNHAYGIDGYITIWKLDKNGNGDIEAGDGDRVYLYFGLRRGGRAYYALDVTDVAAPELLWKIEADSNEFSHLGQSWSKPYLARIRTGDSDLLEVVIFTGGYDTNQDEEGSAGRNSTDSMGNDVFIVNAKNGDYIWSLQGGSTGNSPDVDVSELTHSIPGGARLLDMNRDGAIDRMYFADTYGQVWRLELPMGPSYDLSDSKLILFAALGKKVKNKANGNINKNSRMFFNEPDVALLKHTAGSWLTISIGSGYRAHPVSESVEDHFYVLLDKAVYSPLEKNLAGTGDFEALEKSDLVKVQLKNGALKKGKLEKNSIFDIDNKAGWYLELPEPGEKVLSNSITTTGSVMFTTLVPGSGAAAAVADPCTAPTTQGRFYSLNILTADAGSDLTKDGEITDEDLFAVVSSNEIPGPPQRVFNDPVCVEEECEQIVDIRVGKKRSPVAGYDSAFLESVFWTNPPNDQ